MFGVLFVCMGNICRSPMAEGVFRHLALEAGLTESPRTGIIIDSAGTSGYHVGDPPDRRGQRVAKRYGIDLSGLRSRRVERHDFDDFDMILAMDEDNMALLRERCPPDLHERLGIFLDYAPDIPFSELPDPYYGDEADFERCYSLVEQAAQGLLAKIIAEQFPDLR